MLSCHLFSPIPFFSNVGYGICREGAKVMWGYVNRLLGQPSLIRESSIAKFPWSGLASKFSKKMSTFASASGKAASMEGGTSLNNIILHPSLKRRIEQLARATENTKSHEAPFRNMLFYGPPGTGKTMVAKEMARKSVKCCIIFSCYFKNSVLLQFIISCPSMSPFVACYSVGMLPKEILCTCSNFHMLLTSNYPFIIFLTFEQ